jgi:hypothetical protein
MAEIWNRDPSVRSRCFKHSSENMLVMCSNINSPMYSWIIKWWPKFCILPACIPLFHVALKNFGVLHAWIMKTAVFWVVPLCSFFLAYSSSLKMEAVSSSDTSVSLPTSRHYNAEDYSLHSHWHEHVRVKVKVIVRVTLRLAVYLQSVRLGAKPLEDHHQRFFLTEPFRS